jgi:hypothetical protein
MDPHVDRPGLRLPQPSPEQGAAAFGGQYQSPEAGSAAAEMAPSAPTAAPPLPPMAQPMPAPQVSNPLPQNAPGTVSSTGSADDSSDALDEEWVNKAKAIIERTKNDPYVESRELGKAKADYLRIRYNKQIKVAEDH